MAVGRRVIAVAVSWVLMVILWPGVPSAAAAPSSEGTPVGNAGRRNSLGELTAPDEVSARQIAKILGERVEVVGARTEFSSTWALPDGTMSSGVASGPVWVRNGGDGTELEDWSEVDVNLVASADGAITPKGHPAKVMLSGGGSGLEQTLATVTDRNDERSSITLGWGRKLPTPTLDGARATYSEALPGVDLILEVTRTGVEQYLVLKDRFAAANVAGLSLPVKVTGRYAMKQDVDSGATIMDGATEVARVGKAEVWDARMDAARSEPLTQKAKRTEAPEPALARSLGRQPEWAKSDPRAAKPEASPTKVELKRGKGHSFPDVAAKPDVAAGAGRGRAAGNGDPRTIPNLLLPQSTEVLSGREAKISMAVPLDYLQDPATVFPVVVDPSVDYMWGFDTWVSKEWANTDKSGATFLRIGGASGRARSFIHFNVGQTSGKRIMGAELNLFETHAWSCQPRNWELWDTGHASTSTRWGAQPAWYGRWATSSETTGYSSSCGDGWVGVDARNLVQAWADSGQTGTVAVGLKAENEADNYALKEFNSANAGSYVPALWVHYDTAPSASTDLGVVPSNLVDGVSYTNKSTPMLRATGHDADGDDLFAIYRLHQGVNGPILWEANRWVPQGVPADISVATNGGALQDGGEYIFIAHAMDTSNVWNTAASMWHRIIADFTAPPAPVKVTSSLYASDGTWNGDVGTAGTFKVVFGSGEVNPNGFLWGVDGPPSDQNHPLGDELNYIPTTAGRHVLNVQAIDKAGNTSPVVSYAFNVGQGAIVSPSDGGRVVRRVRLEIDAMPHLSDIRFQWRRGPESATQSDVPNALLSTASGSAFSAPWQSRAQMGGYATLDAAQLVGYTGGPFQVRPVFRGSDGVEKLGAWVGLFVDPNADGASSDSIGPGGVNLLTGDYSLSATDADEFGLNVGRTSSSRDLKLGLVPQRERLNSSQAGFTAAPDGYNGGSFTRVTNLGHSGGDSLRLVSATSDPDSYVGVGGDTGAMRLNMKAGRTYRVSGWIYVPAATGLVPEHPRGLSLAGFYRKEGTYSEPLTTNSISARPKVVDAWQFLTFDFQVPVGADEAFVRLYNGNAGNERPVYFDDISVREVWAPLGPQWALGTADVAAGTDYLRLEKSTEDTAVIHTDGGGEIWFTASGDGRWYPEIGSEGLNLTESGGVWTLVELDGSVSVFRPVVAGGPAMLETTSPPAAPGKTRMVYEQADDLSRLTRIIGPTEPGIDPASCVAATPAIGCEVTQLTYSSLSTAGPSVGTVGAFPGQLAKVSVWSTRPDTRKVELQDVVEYRYDERGRLIETWDPRLTPEVKTIYGYDEAGHVTTLTPAGELPWHFAYAAGTERTSPSGDLIDANPGRLQSVTRASLIEGSASTIGPDNTTTVLYGVPLTRAAGGPHDLDAAAISAWAQRGAPTDATAVFGPHATPASTDVTPDAPGPNGYGDATVHYLDSSGREVNTASPIGGVGVDAALKRIGYIDSAEFDRFGNTVRALDATNRLIALGVGPTAASDMAELNLASLGTAERSLRLSSASTYSADGIDLLRSVKPIRSVSTSAGPQLVRLVTTNTYDEGKPDAQAYHLLTTATTTAQPIDFPDDPAKAVDAVTTRTGYAPTALGGVSGWTVKQPTSVTVGDGANAVTSLVKYDSAGRAITSQRPTVGGVPDWGTRTVFYTAGVNPDDGQCGNRPEWAGQACLTAPTSVAVGADANRMGNTLPSKRVEGYSRYGTPVKVSETSTGAGATKRTTLTTLDAAERTLTTAVKAEGAASVPVAAVTTIYDSRTGQAVESRTDHGSVKRTLDSLGRTLSYTDASGASATSAYDRFGQPKLYVEKSATGTEIGRRTFSYDRAQDPRGFLTSVHDSVAGTLTATYGADGQLLTQGMPGGVRLEIGYDATREPISRVYKRASSGQTIASSNVTVNSQGKWATHNTTASSSRYTYDAVGRLTGTQQSLNGVCTWRQYDFNARSDRTAKRTRTVDGACPELGSTMGAPTEQVAYTYDSADRLVSDTSAGASPWAYDALGRMTAYRSALDPSVTVNATYFDNDRVASQTISGVASMAWTLDPLGRFDTHTHTPVSGVSVTKQNHYADDGDSPTWVHENTSDPDAITRYVDGPDGQLALSTGKSGGRILNLVDLHGDVMGTLPLADGANGAADIGKLAFQATDEFGVQLDLNTGGVATTAGPRYGYLGGAQRSAETLGGVILMGVRVYQAGVGRFTSIDPEPGGNASEYDYVHGDPVNNTDLDGNWPNWKSVLGIVARVAEVAAFIPGPIGTVAGFVSAGAYLATGNTRKAAEMALTGAANMIGAGLAVRALVKVAGAAAKIGRTAGRVTKAVRAKVVGRGCNSFAAATSVLGADGRSIPISDVAVGDRVWAEDPVAGSSGSQPVVATFSYGGNHLMVDIRLESGEVLEATDLHPFWIEETQQWVDAIDLKPGDELSGATGEGVLVEKVSTRTAEVEAYNLTVEGLHTYFVGADRVLTHNAKPRCGSEMPAGFQPFGGKGKQAPNAPSKKNVDSGFYGTRAEALRAVRKDKADLKGGTYCMPRMECSPRKRHLHLDLFNRKGQIVETRHYGYERR